MYMYMWLYILHVHVLRCQYEPLIVCYTARSNFLGTAFTAYDSGENPARTVSRPREELATISYVSREREREWEHGGISKRERERERERGCVCVCTCVVCVTMYMYMYHTIGGQCVRVQRSTAYASGHSSCHRRW